MDQLCISHYGLAERMFEDAIQDKNAYAVMFFDDAAELMRELLEFCDVSVGSIECSPSELNGYCKEYYVVLNEHRELYVEPAMNKDNQKYLRYEADTLYIDGDASASIIRQNMSDDCACYEIVWGAEEDDEYDDYDDEYDEDDDGAEEDDYECDQVMIPVSLNAMLVLDLPVFQK